LERLIEGQASSSVDKLNLRKLMGRNDKTNRLQLGEYKPLSKNTNNYDDICIKGTVTKIYFKYSDKNGQI
jgi:hypothetical protein